MAKKGSSKGNKSKPKQKKATVPSYVSRILLDPAAVRYRSLLLDPCQADLAHPLYGGTDAGILARFSTTNIYFNGAGNTGGIIHWTPGCMSSDNHEIVFTAATSSTTSVAALGATGAPGKGFLPTNTQGYRCVAACMRVIYHGTESTRSGMMWYGHTNGNLVNIGTSYATTDILPNLPNSERTPVGYTDIIWRPNEADSLWRTAGDALGGGENKAQRSSITLAAVNLPSNVGLQIQMIAVYEYVPNPISGMAVSRNSRSSSSNTLSQVMNTIKDGAWIRSMAGAAVGALVEGLPGASFMAPMLNYVENRLVTSRGRRIEAARSY
jgi:hypothetical protein